MECIQRGIMKYRELYKKVKKTMIYTKFYGIKNMIHRNFDKYQVNEQWYSTWFEQNKVTQEEIKIQKQQRFVYEPVISILVPVYNTPQKYLQQMIESVCEQTYDKWELCIANANPENLEVQIILDEYKKKDSRIKVVDVPENLGIAQNTNKAYEISTGQYIALLDHDDMLATNALYEVVRTINEKNKSEVIYTDEDKISENSNEHFQPNFKPEFNLDLLRANNYICHLFVFKRTLIKESEPFREEYNGAQDYDLILRCTEQAENIAHISKILYHWRMHRQSTADNPASKLYAYDAGERALQAHLKRCGEVGRIEKLDDLGFYKIIYESKDNKDLVTTVIKSDGEINYLKKCINSLKEMDYENLQIIVVDMGNQSSKVEKYYQFLEGQGIQVVKGQKDSFSATINIIKKQIKGEYILLLSQYIEFQGKKDLEQLLANCQREKIGVVGARSYYRNHTIRHAGIGIGGEKFSYRLFEGLPNMCKGYMHREALQQELSAVSMECMMLRKSLLEQIDGFDDKLGDEFAAIDFCLRVKEKQYRVLYVPTVVMRYNTSYDKERIEAKNITIMMQRWKNVYENQYGYSS